MPGSKARKILRPPTSPEMLAFGGFFRPPEGQFHFSVVFSLTLLRVIRISPLTDGAARVACFFGASLTGMAGWPERSGRMALSLKGAGTAASGEVFASGFLTIEHERKEAWAALSLRASSWATGLKLTRQRRITFLIGYKIPLCRETERCVLVNEIVILPD